MKIFAPLSKIMAEKPDGMPDRLKLTSSFHVRDRQIKVDVVKLALAVQLSAFGLVGLSEAGIRIPVVREIIVLAYLALTPGMLVLKIAGINTNSLKTLLLSTGISLSIVTLLSTLESMILAPFFEKPLSELPLVMFLGFFNILLILLCWSKGNRYYSFSFNLSPGYLLPLFLPILIVIGRAVGNYTLLFTTLVIICVLPIVVLLSGAHERAHPSVIWAISLSLLFLTLLFKRGFNERFDDQFPILTEAVAIAGIWTPRFPSIHNSLLFPTIFYPTFSILSGMDIALGTRTLSCIIFSLIPIILYEIYRKLFSPLQSFLASCLYAFYPLYFQLTNSTRTGFGFLYVSILLLLILSEEINLRSKSVRALSVAFAFSVIISHYGVAYMLMILLILVSVLCFFDKKFRNFADSVSYTYVASFITTAFSWYLYTSGTTCLDWGVKFGYHVITNLDEFFSSESSASMRALTTRSVTPSFSLEATKWLLVTLLAFIVIGAIKLVYLAYAKRKTDSVGYSILTIAFCFPLFALTLAGMPRIFGFSLILTAPLSIWGLSEILKLIGLKEHKRLLIFSLYLFTFSAFSYGIVAKSINSITREARDVSLYYVEEQSLMESDDPNIKRFVYLMEEWKLDSNVKASEWFLICQNPNEEVYADSLTVHRFLLHLLLPREYEGRVLHNLTQPKIGGIDNILKENEGRTGYIFLAYHNIKGDYVSPVEGQSEIMYKTSDYQHIFESENRIYDNGGDIIYES